MAFLSSMNISGSGMTAQKLRMDIIAENISNIDTTRTEKGGPYVKKSVVFQSIEDNNFKSQLD
ncbi:MAG: flagellar basal body protein, partial [Oscillospiraceae bacterium]